MSTFAPTHNAAPAHNNLRAPPDATDRALQPTTTPISGETINRALPKKRANVCIATLNVNRASAQNMTHVDKWSAIYKMMKDEKIAVLATQETHLDDDHLSDIQRRFNRHIST